MPEPLVKAVGTKIMDLVNPTIKMSKSAENPKGVIFLSDDLDVIRKKIMSATTDSEMEVRFDTENKPGISNLMTLYGAFTNKKIEDIELEFKGKNYGEFKTAVADAIVNFISHIQTEYNKYMNSNVLDEILDKGIEKVRIEARKKYLEVKEKVGLIR
jgi:tryptophanyl-tRNA synthetase